MMIALTLHEKSLQFFLFIKFLAKEINNSNNFEAFYY